VGLSSVAEELGNLPLALEGAVSYMNELGISPNQYLGVLQSQPKKLLSSQQANTPYENSVLGALRMNLKHAKSSCDHAELMINTIGMLSPSILNRQVILSTLNSMLSAKKQGPIDEFDFNSLLQSASRLSLIDVTFGAIEVHTLVRKAIVLSMNDSTRDRLAESLVSIFVSRILETPPQVKDWPKHRPSVMHLVSILAVGATIGREMSKLLDDLFLNIENLSFSACDYPTSESASRVGLRISKGVHSIHVAGHYNHLGNALRNQGKLGEALDAYRRCLALLESRNDGYPEVAGIMNNIGSIYWRQGDNEAAEDIFLKALQINTHKNGKINAINSTIFNSLGILRQSQKSMDDAKLYFEQALAIDESLHGVVLHSDIERDCFNLAQINAILGNFEVANSLFKRAEHIARHLFGEANFERAKCLYFYGRCLLFVGEKEKGASAIYEAVDAFVALGSAPRVIIEDAKVIINSDFSVPERFDF
jgi:hypothetical protein